MASSRPATSRSTRCLAPNTPRTTIHLAQFLPSPLDLRVQAVHSTHPVLDRRYPLSPPLPLVPDLSTPPSSSPRLSLAAAQLHSLAPPPSHLCPKKWPIGGPRAPLKLLHLAAKTATGLELFHLLLSHPHLHTEQKTLPDTLTPHRSALTASLRNSLHIHTPAVLLIVFTRMLVFLSVIGSLIKPDLKFISPRLLRLIHTLTPCRTHRCTTSLVQQWYNGNRTSAEF